MTTSRGNSRSNATKGKVETIMTTEQAPTEISEGGIRVDMNTKMQFTISVPVGLKIALDKAANEADTTVLDFARSTLAASVGYSLPATGKRASKFASEEEKKAVQAARNKQRRDLLNKLLEQYQEIDDEDEDD